MPDHASGFSLEIIRDYLLNEGGKVEYHRLIKHFRHSLADPSNKEARVLFKDLVNKVAVVTNEANGKYLNLRPNFLPESSRPSSITSNPDNVSAAALQHVPHSISNSRNLESSFQHVQNVAPIHPHLIIANKPPHEILPHHSNPYAAPCPVRDQQYINYHAQMAPPSHFAPQSIKLNQNYHNPSQVDSPYRYHNNKENSSYYSNTFANTNNAHQPIGLMKSSNTLGSVKPPPPSAFFPPPHANQQSQPFKHPANFVTSNARAQSLPLKRVPEHVQTQYVSYSPVALAADPNVSGNVSSLTRAQPNTIALPSISESKSRPTDLPLSSASISTSISASSRDTLDFSSNESNDKENADQCFTTTEQLLRNAGPMPTNRSVEMRPHSSNINSIWSQPEAGDRPPKPPPRRKSFASTSNTYLQKKNAAAGAQENENCETSMPKPFTDKLKEIHELTFNSPGRVKEHAKKLNKMVSESELRPPMPSTPSNGSGLNPLKDETDALLGASEPLKRRWMVKSSSCDYNEMLQMLRDCPKLAGFKDYTSTALHWAAKFNKPDIIKLIAGTHGISPNVRTNGGHTPLHLAAMFNNREIVELLIKGYGADEKIRDYAGRLPLEILRQNSQIKRKEALVIENSAIAAHKHSGSLLARTASLRQTHRQLLERLPSKYRTVK